MLGDTILLVRSLPRLALFVGRALGSPHISRQTKAHLAVAGLYVFSPIDLLPEKWLGEWGAIDDVLVVIVAIDRLLNAEPQAIVEQLWGNTHDPQLEQLRALFRRWGSGINGTIRPLVWRWVARATGESTSHT